MRASAILLILGLMVVGPASAALYKCRQADGTIVYTDKPCVSGEEMKLPSLQTYTPAPVPKDLFAKKTTGKKDDKSESYDSLTIIAPKNDSRIQAGGTGNVDIVVRPQPALHTVQGHVFAIVLDGKQLPTTGVTNTIRLKNVNRGTHSVQILILSKTRAVVQASNTVSFTVGRPTVYNPALVPQSGTDSNGNPTTILAPGTPRAPAAPGAPRAPRAP